MNNVKTGDPLIRPLWWLAPNDQHAQVCDDQFLLGNDILVAPVVVPAARNRNIYLPSGQWHDHWTGQVFLGPIELSNYSVPLDILPFFERQ